MELISNSSRKHFVIFTIFMFYLLFAPPILGVHSLYFIALLSIIYCMINNGSFCKFINYHNLIYVYIILCVMLCWSLFLVLISDGSRSVPIHYIYWITAIIPGAIAIGIHVRKSNNDIEYVLDLILWAGFIQSLFSIAAFLNGDIKQFLLQKLQSDGTLVMTTYKNEIYYRLFGFSSGLTFDMPATMSAITCIALYLAIYKSFKYLWFVPSIAFSAIINARTSVVIIVIGVILLFFIKETIDGKSIRSFVVIAGIIFIGLIAGILILQRISPLTYGWIKSGIGQIIGFFQQENNSGYFEYVTNANRWQLPSGLALLFGTGFRTMGGSEYGFSSDVGYINDIWFGGLLYTIVLYFIVICFIIKMIFQTSREKRCAVLRYISLLYLITLPFLNIKTFIIAMGAFINMYIIISMYYYLFNEKSRIEVRNIS